MATTNKQQKQTNMETSFPALHPNRLFDPLTSYRLPGRLNAVQAARLLGFQTHDIPVLITARLLEPLGKPVPNAPKYFAAVALDVLRSDPAWLDKATKSISRHWRDRNGRKSPQLAIQEGPAA